MEKNLLSDTDYTSGRDNRYKNIALIGKVSKIECDDKHANVRVIFPDKVDSKGTPLVSKPIPVLQISAGKKRSYAIPRVGQNALLLKLPNSTSDYLVVGTFYTTKDPPPVTDPKLDYCEYDDGSTMQFDPDAGTLTWNLKGGIVIDTQDDITITGAAKVTIKGADEVLIQSDTRVHLKGPVTIEGNITHTGNMSTSGVHTDSNGVHQ